ncbi:hypothetical protein LTR08_005988 [Meristemomyces frigidus]|nr:hypothetical protein LTR08_005988 [Meristemomyces frigidus]
MREGPLKQAILAIRNESEQNLKDIRHSFITTPLRVLTALIEQASPPRQPVTWLAIFRLSGWIVGNLFLTLASLGLIYGMAFCLIAIANFSKNGYRLQRPPDDQVRAIAQLLGIIHVTVVFTLATLFGFDSDLEVPVTYAVLLAYSVGSITMLFIVVVFGGTVLVAVWKMLKATVGNLQWPSEQELAVAGEKTGLRDDDGGQTEDADDEMVADEVAENVVNVDAL